MVRRAAVLPLVPRNEVEDVWWNALEDLEDVQVPAETTRFTDYITEYWIEGNRVEWNQYNNDGPRTTNNLEGWHSKLKKYLQHPHPNIYKLIEMLKREQAANEIKQIQYAAGGKRVPRKRKYREIDDRLARLKMRHRDSEITTIQYADAASYLLHMD